MTWCWFILIWREQKQFSCCTGKLLWTFICLANMNNYTTHFHNYNKLWHRISFHNTMSQHLFLHLVSETNFTFWQRTTDEISTWKVLTWMSGLEKLFSKSDWNPYARACIKIESSTMMFLLIDSPKKIVIGVLVGSINCINRLNLILDV